MTTFYELIEKYGSIDDKKALANGKIPDKRYRTGYRLSEEVEKIGANLYFIVRHRRKI